MSKRKIKNPANGPDSVSIEEIRAAIELIRKQKIPSTHSCALCNGNGNCQLQDH